MSIQLTVSVRGSNNSVSIVLPSAKELGISEDEERTTAAAVLGSVSECARKDPELTEEQSKALQLQPSTKSSEEDNAVLVGKKIVKLAEELELQLSGDENVKEFVSECVEDTDSRRASDTTFELFQRIVGLVLECDENGIPTNMAFGRVAALFGLCYVLCKAFVKTYSLQLVYGFIKRVIGYLITFLARSRFFSWLRGQGGWSNLLKSIASSNKYITAGVIAAAVVGLGVLTAVVIYKSK